MIFESLFEATRNETTYRLLGGGDIGFEHHGEPVALSSAVPVATVPNPV